MSQPNICSYTVLPSSNLFRPFAAAERPLPAQDLRAWKQDPSMPPTWREVWAPPSTIEAAAGRLFDRPHKVIPIYFSRSLEMVPANTPGAQSGYVSVEALARIVHELALSGTLSFDQTCDQIEQSGPAVFYLMFELSLRAWVNAGSGQENRAEACTRICTAARHRERHLSLTGLNLTDLPDVLSQLNTVRTLSLCDNPLGEIPEVVFRMPNLSTLMAMNTHLTHFPEGLRGIAGQIGEIHLSGNRIQELPDWIEEFSNLTEFYIGRNLLSCLPESMSRMRSLALLSITDNQINRLPLWMATLPSLRHIWAKGPELDHFPSHLRLAFDRPVGPLEFLDFNFRGETLEGEERFRDLCRKQVGGKTKSAVR